MVDIQHRRQVYPASCRLRKINPGMACSSGGRFANVRKKTLILDIFSMR
jgi:hypothetical protein